MTTTIDLENEFEVLRYDSHVPVAQRPHRYTLGRFPIGEGAAKLAMSPMAAVLHVEERAEYWSEEHEDECLKVEMYLQNDIGECNCREIKAARRKVDADG